MLIKEILFGPYGLLKPEIQAAQFERIYYDALCKAVGLPDEIGYSPQLDQRIKAHLVYGSIINSRVFLFRGTILYTLDGELLALSWKNCDPCPTRFAFFKDSNIDELHSLLSKACFPISASVSFNLLELDHPFQLQ